MYNSIYVGLYLEKKHGRIKGVRLDKLATYTIHCMTLFCMKIILPTCCFLIVSVSRFLQWKTAAYVGVGLDFGHDTFALEQALGRFQFGNHF